jgi:hypothetical protein
VVATSGCGGSKGSQGANQAPAPRSSYPSTGCRKKPLLGVHTPDRLRVLDACRAIVGTVREPEANRGDGDVTFNLLPDPAYASMLNEKNVKEGGIHVEIVPADQAGCVKGRPVEHPGVTGLGDCTGAHVKLPRAGAHVRVVGAYVLDVTNAWREIHPAWKITVP